jgi:lipopolysaccharide export system protein LptA
MNKKLFSFAVSLVFCSLLFAEKITFSADSMSGIAGDKATKTSLIGHAFVKTVDMEISADEITLDGDDFRFITAVGTVSGKNTKSNMDFTCGKMSFDRTTEVALIEDTVHLVDNENNVTIDAQLIEYNQKTEIAVMQINVTLKQKDNTCTSAYAVYRKKAQMLEMSGNPKIVQGDDTFRAQEITLNLDTQEITLDGRVSGTVTDSKKSETPDEKADEKKPDAEKQPPEAEEVGAHEGELPAEDAPVALPAEDDDAEESEDE